MEGDISSLEGIDIFVKVVDCSSFTGAARLLGMPVTTVSGQIRALEARLGASLLNRTTRKVTATEFGRIYYQHCIKAVEEMANAERALQSSQSEPEGILRLTASPDIGHQVLPPIIKRYLSKYPKVRVDLILTNRTIDLVGESVDLAIRPGPLRDSVLIAKKFRESESFLCASAEYIKRFGLPRSFSDIISHAFVHFKPFGDPVFLTDGKGNREISPRSKIMVDDLEAAKVYVQESIGIGLLPALICEKELKSEKLVKIFPQWRFLRQGQTIGQLFIVYPPHKFVPPKIRAFVEIAVAGSAQKQGVDDE